MYGIISCAVSFWTPATVMAVAYVRIYRVAKQQQEQIYSLTYSMGQCIVNLDQVNALVWTYRSQAGARVCKILHVLFEKCNLYCLKLDSHVSGCLSRWPARWLQASCSICASASFAVREGGMRVGKGNGYSPACVVSAVPSRNRSWLVLVY